MNRYNTMDITNATTTVSKKESKNCPTEENVAAIFSVGVLIFVSVSYMAWADKINWYRYGESNPGLQDENLLS